MEDAYFLAPRVLKMDSLALMVVVLVAHNKLISCGCLFDFSRICFLLIGSDPLMLSRPIQFQVIWGNLEHKKSNSLKVCFYQY